MPEIQPIDQVDQLIQEGSPLVHLLPFFPNEAELFNYYAHFMSKRLHADPNLEQCEFCGDSEEVHSHTVKWYTDIESHYDADAWHFALGLLLAHLIIKRVTTYLIFETKHAICKACIKRWRWRLASAFIRRVLGGIVAFIAIGFWIGVITFGSLDWRDWSSDDTRSLVITFGTAALLTWIAVALFKKAKRMRIPSTLQSIGRFPFKFQKFD